MFVLFTLSASAGCALFTVLSLTVQYRVLCASTNSEVGTSCFLSLTLSLLLFANLLLMDTFFCCLLVGKTLCCAVLCVNRPPCYLHAHVGNGISQCVDLLYFLGPDGPHRFGNYNLRGKEVTREMFYLKNIILTSDVLFNIYHLFACEHAQVMKYKNNGVDGFSWRGLRNVINFFCTGAYAVSSAAAVSNGAAPSESTATAASKKQQHQQQHQQQQQACCAHAHSHSSSPLSNTSSNSSDSNNSFFASENTKSRINNFSV